MQDDKTLHTLEILVKVANLFKGTPYDWDSNKKCLQISFSRSKRICTLCTKLNIVMYLVYLTFRLAIEITASKHTNFVAVTWMMIWIYYYIWAAISFYNAEVCCKDVAAIFKGVKKLYSEMSNRSDMYQHQHQLHASKPIFMQYNILQLKIIAVLWILVSLNAAVSLMFLVIPRKPQYISSILNEKLNNPLIFGAFALFEFYSKASASFVDSMDGFHVLVTVFVAVCCMDGIRVCKSSLRAKIRDYRKLQVLVTAFNHSNTKALLLFICFWGPGGFILVAGFASIRFHGYVSIFEYTPFPISLQNCVIIMFLSVMSTSSIHESSQKLMQSITLMSCSVAPNKIIRREMRALRPVGVSTGSVKVIKKIAVFKIIYLVSDTLMTALVTFPPEVFFREKDIKK